MGDFDARPHIPGVGVAHGILLSMALAQARPGAGDGDQAMTEALERIERLEQEQLAATLELRREMQALRETLEQLRAERAAADEAQRRTEAERFELVNQLSSAIELLRRADMQLAVGSFEAADTLADAAYLLADVPGPDAALARERIQLAREAIGRRDFMDAHLLIAWAANRIRAITPLSPPANAPAPAPTPGS